MMMLMLVLVVVVAVLPTSCLVLSGDDRAPQPLAPLVTHTTKRLVHYRGLFG